jgi:tRNA threonylcarbamoyladenosine biosynthesis protein TsaB
MENRKHDILLAVDNSLASMTIVLSEFENIIEERHIHAYKPPSEIIAPCVSSILSKHACTINDVSTVIVTLGPGSFTGIRVALAFCKGIKAGSCIPLIGLPTLDVLAFPFRSMEGYYLSPIIDAKKGEVFFCLYQAQQENLKRLTDYQAIKPEELSKYLKKPCLLFGSGAGLCKKHLHGYDGIAIIAEWSTHVSGEALIKYGLETMAKNEPYSNEPIYARRSEAEIKYGITIG